MQLVRVEASDKKLNYFVQFSLLSLLNHNVV
jgi:hypothetical protein